MTEQSQEELNAASIEQQLYRLQGALDAHCRMAKQVNHDFAPQLNFFEMIDGVWQEERVHTPFLKNLLDPKGKHGLGSFPLRAFFEKCMKAEYYSGNRHVKIRKEELPLPQSIDFEALPFQKGEFDKYEWTVKNEIVHTRPDSISEKIRFDLEIKGKAKDKTNDGYLIIVENKTGSTDNTNQLDDYFSWLCEKDKTEADRVTYKNYSKYTHRWLIFLRPKSTTLPEKVDQDRTTCALMPYRDSNNAASLESIIKAIRAETPAGSRLLYILDHYLEILPALAPLHSDSPDPGLEYESDEDVVLADLLLKDNRLFKMWHDIYREPDERLCNKLLKDTLKPWDVITSKSFEREVTKQLSKMLSCSIKSHFERNDALNRFLFNAESGYWRIIYKPGDYKTKDKLYDTLWLPQVRIWFYKHDKHERYICTVKVVKDNKEMRNGVQVSSLDDTIRERIARIQFPKRNPLGLRPNSSFPFNFFHAEIDLIDLYAKNDMNMHMVLKELIRELERLDNNQSIAAECKHIIELQTPENGSCPNQKPDSL